MTIVLLCDYRPLLVERERTGKHTLPFIGTQVEKIGGGWSPGIPGWPTGGGEMVGGWILGRKDGPPAEDVCVCV